MVPTSYDEHLDTAVLTFADGIPGFGGLRRFLLSDLTDDAMFQVLTCVDDPELSLVVASPWLFFGSYAPELPESDRLSLGIDEPTDAIVFCSVVVEDDRLSMNLKAPFVANARNRQARQVVLEDRSLALRTPLTVAADPRS